jgi:hypothetical protein
LQFVVNEEKHRKESKLMEGYGINTEQLQVVRQFIGGLALSSATRERAEGLLSQLGETSQCCCQQPILDELSGLVEVEAKEQPPWSEEGLF